MNKDIILLANSYISWMRRSVAVEAFGEDAAELATPFLDCHKDHLQIYAERRDDDVYLLTDDGYILSELKSSGIEVHGRHRDRYSLIS